MSRETKAFLIGFFGVSFAIGCGLVVYYFTGGNKFWSNMTSGVLMSILLLAPLFLKRSAPFFYLNNVLHW